MNQIGTVTPLLWHIPASTARSTPAGAKTVQQTNDLGQQKILMGVAAIAQSRAPA